LSVLRLAEMLETERSGQKMRHEQDHNTIYTPYGPAVIIWKASESNAKIVRVLLSNPAANATKRASELYPGSHEASCEEIDWISSAIRRFLEGEPIDIGLGVADLSVCGEFQKRVLRAEHAIPSRRVSTYKLIAAHLGGLGGARAVGSALAKNPFPLIVPCHRAVRSDRGLGGYQGGVEMKRSLLGKEGIVFDVSGRGKCSHFHYG